MFLASFGECCCCAFILEVGGMTHVTWSKCGWHVNCQVGVTSIKALNKSKDLDSINSSLFTICFVMRD